jgi:hypothetical protein
MNNMTIICPKCGKALKNERGLAIHNGHIHKKADVYAELQEIKQALANLQAAFKNMQNGETVNWKNLQEIIVPNSGIIPTGFKGYGAEQGALMDELKLALKDRAVN